MINYIEVNIEIDPLNEFVRDIIASILVDEGFESFSDTETGMLAYIPENLHSVNYKAIVADNQMLSEYNFTFTENEVEQRNWNKEWESNFDPVFVDTRCIVKAPFHNIEQKYEYEIIIVPKMSFGTGHHATTSQMMRYILDTDMQDKIVLDMGCGTSVLAMLASMRGAKQLLAIDIDEWAYTNSIENIERNNCSNIEVKQGDVALIKGLTFDIVLANINRNILLNDIKHYGSVLNSQGELYLSGFYKEDLVLLEKECNANGLKFISSTEDNKWVAAKFVKE